MGADIVTGWRAVTLVTGGGSKTPNKAAISHAVPIYEIVSLVFVSGMNWALRPEY